MELSNDQDDTTIREREDKVILALCAEAGDDISHPAEVIAGFRTNYPDWMICDAANGDVEALISLRMGCGLPIFR